MRQPIAVDLFCGAGGLSLGLKQAGFQTILANEIEQDFASTFLANHPETSLLVRDVHEVDFGREMKGLGLKPGDFDLLAGGPPCQGFSTVGKKDVDDPRNSLFQQYLRAVHELSPKIILFENVSGFKLLYNGRMFSKLLENLDSMGYSTASSVLDAVWFGLPQYRQRTIVVGWKSRCSFRFPEPTNGFGFLVDKPYVTLMEAISDLPPLRPSEERHEYLVPAENDFQKSIRSDCTELTEHACANYGERMRRILSLIPPGGTVDDLPLELRPKSYFRNTYARLLPNRPAPTITRNFGTPSSSRCVHPYQDRALSTREGSRLQGFPDDYVFIGSKGSKNLQIGNAVPPVFGALLGNAIKSQLLEG